MKILKTVKSFVKNKKFSNSTKYWMDRYNNGGNSGKGSYDKFAEFKGNVINKLIKEKNINSIIELGCGDGNQLKHFNITSYSGIDISKKIITDNKTKFKGKKDYDFILLDDFIKNPFKADATMSLDVIYHLVEDDVFYNHMKLLFENALKYVIIYSSNKSIEPTQPHVRHRKFEDWITFNQPGFTLERHIPNIFTPEKYPDSYSLADFYIYKKKI
mgnify:CR=1 FL=1